VDSGDIIGSRYRLDRKIGEGGTGRIWLAQDERLDRRVAIKFLFAHTAAQQARLAKRVSLEAKIAASIQHPNVIQIFDFGTHEGTIPYIVMEALSGHTLGEAFDATESFSLDTLLQIMSEVLRGLAAVHDAGIVHRDLKPENIFLIKESRGKLSPKLLDFGISRSLEPDMRPSAVTTTEGMILGTPQYMSPEQAKGDTHIDKRTDIYSIGTVMFEAIAGIVPFPADNTAELLISVIQRKPPPLFELAPQVGPALCAVVDKALAKDRNARYAHAAEMLDALVAAALEVPAELDRKAALFPPNEIRTRSQHRRGIETTRDISDSRPPVADALISPRGTTSGHAAPYTVVETGRRGKRRNSRPRAADLFASDTPPPVSKLARFTHSRTTWVGLAAIAALGTGVAGAALFLERNREPEGSGLIVVQAPNYNNVAAAQLPKAPEPREQVAPDGVAVVELDEKDDPRPKKPAAKSRKPAAPVDPLQLMAARVAEAFSKQKASVISCLNEHAGDLDGEAQLQVRLRIDRDGRATNAELQPETISNKPVARCLEATVRNMTFPAPEQPTTFRVPLLWRRK
jgi:eukaryotic-like serine/threonine-protein kinase